MTPTPTSHPLGLLRASLVVVWLGTAVASALTHRTAGVDVLQRGGLEDALLIQVLIWGGAAADLAMGLALWRYPHAWTYRAALALMAAMTAIATLLLPSLWIDPLGPLLKNLPIATALWLLQHDANRRPS